MIAEMQKFIEDQAAFNRRIVDYIERHEELKGWLLDLSYGLKGDSFVRHRIIDLVNKANTESS